MKDSSYRMCNRKGILRILGNYARVRHYVGLGPGKKPRFEYPKQNLQHARNTLDEPKKKQIDPIGQDSIDPKLLNNGASHLEVQAGVA